MNTDAASGTVRFVGAGVSKAAGIDGIGDAKGTFGRTIEVRGGGVYSNGFRPVARGNVSSSDGGFFEGAGMDRFVGARRIFGRIWEEDDGLYSNRLRAGSYLSSLDEVFSEAAVVLAGGARPTLLRAFGSTSADVNNSSSGFDSKREGEGGSDRFAETGGEAAA